MLCLFHFVKNISKVEVQGQLLLLNINISSWLSSVMVTQNHSCFFFNGKESRFTKHTKHSMKITLWIFGWCSSYYTKSKAFTILRILFEKEAKLRMHINLLRMRKHTKISSLKQLNRVIITNTWKIIIVSIDYLVHL